MRRVLNILLLVGTLVLSACGGSAPSNDSAAVDSAAVDSASADSAAADAQDDEPSVRVQDFRLVEGSSGERQVMGTLHNTTAEVIESAQVQVVFYDADNVQIETMSVPVHDIPAAGTVDFKQPLDTDKEVHSARVRSVLVM